MDLVVIVCFLKLFLALSTLWCIFLTPSPAVNCNFHIFYELDCEFVATPLSLDSYDGDEMHSWVMLEAVP